MKVSDHTIIACASLALVMFFLLAPCCSALDLIRGELSPKGNGRQSAALINNRFGAAWDGKPTSPASTSSWVWYRNPNIMEFRSTQKVSVYVLNETEMIKGLNSNWSLSQFTPKNSSELLTWINTTYILETDLSYQHFKNDWGLENDTTLDKNGNPVYGISFYIVIINEYGGYTEYSLKWQTPNVVIEALGTFFSTFIYVVLFGLGILLLLRGRNENKNPERKGVASKYNNYGYGLICGGIATCSWQVFQWWRAADPEVTWSGTLSFTSMPMWVLGGALSQNLLTFVSLACIGGSLSFMSNTIERDIQKKKIPYLTYALWIAELAIIAFAFLVTMAPDLIIVFGVIIYAWVVALVLVGVNIFITYLKVCIQTTGILRKKSIIIIVSLLLTFGGMILRAYIKPDLLANAIGAIFALCLYKGLTME